MKTTKTKATKIIRISGLMMVVSAWSAAAFAVTVSVSPSQGVVEFDAIGRPSMLKIHGVGTGPEGSFSIEKGKLVGELSFDLNSLDTGISLRNKHMKDKYLKTGEHPKAVLRLDPVESLGTWSAASEIRNAAFTGTLSLSGSSRPVSGTVSITPVAGKSSIEASFGLRLTDFGIELPSFAGVTVADQVQIQVKLSEVSSPGGVK
jgi:polyisoprenoid-binding protein YceI